MFKEIKKHMEAQKENPAEHFRPSAEDKFPRLTQEYWSNPNSSRGKIETCSYKAGIKEQYERSEGI